MSNLDQFKMNKIVNLIKAGLEGATYLAMVMSVVIVGCGDNQTTPPTCKDGIQNQDETGVDCGGSTCAACPTQFWDFPTADHTVEQVWKELPNQVFTDIELFQGNQEYFKFTHKKYGRYTYNQTPDLNQINSIKTTESPRGLRVLGDIPRTTGLVLSQKPPCLRCDDWPSYHRGPIPDSPQPRSDPS